jgi:hypothetical protein
MPCFPGCWGWNDASHGGERAKTKYATSTLAMSSATGTAFVASVCTGADVGLRTQFQKQNAADPAFYASTFGPTPETPTEDMLALTIDPNRPAHLAMKGQLC